MAATTHRWHATTTDYENLPNWDTGVIPGTGGAGLDTTIFDGVSQVHCLLNLDRDGAGAPGNNPLYRVITMPAYGGHVGGVGNYLKQELDSSGAAKSRVVHRGTGQFFHEGPAGAFNDVYVDSARPLSTAAMTLDGVIRNVFVNRGRVEIAATCDLTGTVWCCGQGGHIIMAAGAGSSANRIFATAGAIWNYRPTIATNIIHVGYMGTLYQYGLLLDGTEIIHTGGELTYEPSSAPGAAHNPDIFTNAGALRLDGSPYNIEFNNLVIGPFAGIAGSAEHASGDFSPLATWINMREEYP